jgi:uncharacterized YccA/Bax inhibitor family protein
MLTVLTSLCSVGIYNGSSGPALVAAGSGLIQERFQVSRGFVDEENVAVIFCPSSRWATVIRIASSLVRGGGGVCVLFSCWSLAQAAFDLADLSWVLGEFDGRSDYGPFIEVRLCWLLCLVLC